MHNLAKIKLNIRKRMPKISIFENINTSSNIEYIINDPSTKKLVKNVNPNDYNFNPKIYVDNYVGGGFSRDTVEGQSANVYMTLLNVVNYYNSMSEKPLSGWPGTNALLVYPRAGEGLNAYYDRYSLRFFYSNDKSLNSTMFTSDSSDVVAHELGHAIFDSFRPDTWNVPLLEINSFHEAFADFTSIINILIHEESIDYILEETEGNLRKNNVASKIAEHFCMAMSLIYNVKVGLFALRNANNDFKYSDPNTLPHEAPQNEICAESHSFGRIFLGTLYEILVMMYESFLSEGFSGKDSLIKARDLITKYVLKSVHNAPINAKFYSSFAKTMLWSDVTISDWKFHDKMMGIFTKRNIETITFQPQSHFFDVCPNVQIQTNKTKLVTKISDKLITAQSNNPFYHCELEIPIENSHLFDNNGLYYDSISCSEEDSILSAQSMVDFINSKKKQSDFKIQKGKLTRTKIS